VYIRLGPFESVPARQCYIAMKEEKVTQPYHTSHEYKQLNIKHSVNLSNFLSKINNVYTCFMKLKDCDDDYDT